MSEHKRDQHDDASAQPLTVIQAIGDFTKNIASAGTGLIIYQIIYYLLFAMSAAAAAAVFVLLLFLAHA